MRANFGAYPKNWKLGRPDRNIDHRRVPNLATYWRRQGASLPVTGDPADRSEEHTSELQSLMRISYAVFCWKKKITDTRSRLTTIKRQFTLIKQNDKQTNKQKHTTPNHSEKHEAH